MAGLWAFLLKRKLIAHNWFFEGAIIKRFSGELPAQFSCTRLLFKMLASEGWLGQSWGLKDAMVDILGWEANNHDLNAWLKANKKTAKDMSDAPWEILGKYNQLDSAATYELWQYFGRVVDDNFDTWGRFFNGYMAEAYGEYRQILEANHTGIDVDKQALDEYATAIDARIADLERQFLEFPTVSPHIKSFNENVLQQLRGQEPERLTKAGRVASRWESWSAKMEVYKTLNHFNSDSNAHLQWLFYGQMGKAVVERTEKGDPAVNKAALKKLGEEAALLLAYREQRDVRKFLTSLSDATIDGKYRPSYKVPGAVSSRLSCGEA
jgi:DNA polymerase I-like protein with 3'-5' exonuclease and polymerase domains